MDLVLSRLPSFSGLHIQARCTISTLGSLILRLLKDTTKLSGLRLVDGRL